MSRPIVERIFVVLLAIAVTAAPVTAATLFGLVNTGELYSSPDNGVSWSVLSTLPVSDAIGIGAASTPSELFLATETGILYRSIDAGMNWTAMGSATASDVVDMALKYTGDIFLLTKTGTILNSIDDGATWSAIATLTASDHKSITVAPSGDLFVVTETGVVSQSIDNGVNWTAVGTITISNGVEIRAMGTDLFVLNHTGDIYESTDDGVNWTAVGTLSHTGMVSLTQDGTDLYAASIEGIIGTSNTGASWSFPGHINQLEVVEIGNDNPTLTGIGPAVTPSFTVKPPSPNPIDAATGLTSFSFTLPQNDAVTIAIYNVRGQLVTKRPAQDFGFGPQTVTWDVGNLRSGIYFVRVATRSGFKAHTKLAVVR